VALGDSLTAGRDDLGPGGTRIGWASRLAQLLGERTGVPCALTNLARDGARLEAVLAWQLPALEPAAFVEAWRPDLVSVTVGMNDIRDPGFTPERFAAELGTLLDGLAGTGATVLTCTLPDIAGILPLPVDLVGLARQRLRQVSDVIREQAGRRGTVCLDLWAMAGTADPGLFGPDRIHPNASGHRLIADAFAARLLASLGQVLLQVHAAVAVLGAAGGLAVAEPGVDGLVLGHDLVGVEVEAGQAAPPGLLFGELHQAAAQAGALGGRVDRDVGDVQAVTGLDKLDEPRHRLPGHPQAAGLHLGGVVGQHRGGRAVHPVQVPGVGGGDDVPDGRQVRRGGRAHGFHSVQEITSQDIAH
jgi:lysophospholipase L1-like esterase